MPVGSLQWKFEAGPFPTGRVHSCISFYKKKGDDQDFNNRAYVFFSWIGFSYDRLSSTRFLFDPFLLDRFLSRPTLFDPFSLTTDSLGSVSLTTDSLRPVFSHG
jgi:hypothetical protein